MRTTRTNKVFNFLMKNGNYTPLKVICDEIFKRSDDRFMNILAEEIKLDDRMSIADNENVYYNEH